MKPILVALVLLMQPASGLEIKQVEPTPLFPKPAEGRPLRQLARLQVDNPGEPVAAVARLTVGALPPETQDLGTLAKGGSVASVTLPDIAAPAPLSVELLAKDGSVLASRKQDWQPQKKWTLYCVAYTHQDLGFGDYPHRLRTTIRNANIRLALQYCTETDDWGNDGYRFEIETAEPIPAWIGFAGKEQARELGRRIREGRIQVGGLHNTANTEQYSAELMARQFYLAGRHVPDLLGVRAGRTAQQTDVIGMPVSFPTFAREAGLAYFFHGFNRLAMPHRVGNRFTPDFKELDSEVGESVYEPGRLPAYEWRGPDGQSVLSRATTYERHGLLDDPYERHPPAEQDPRRIEMLIGAHARIQWPFDCFLSQDGTDFILAKRMIADRARNWNARFAWPRLAPATMDMYFDQIGKEVREKQLPVMTIARDANNQWSDQDANDARLLGQARRLGEELPTAEKLSALAQALCGDGYPHLAFYQAYHRLMQYHEHTNAKAGPGNTPEDLRWYETELDENREMVAEGEQLGQAAARDAQIRLNRVIARDGDRNLVVFNALPQSRTDVVRCSSKEIAEGMRLVDETTGKAVAHQRLPDGSVVFVATDVPATGYKVFRLDVERPSGRLERAEARSTSEGVMESRFYRITINPTNGVVTSLRDKELNVELVETNAPHGLNEYLYQRFDNMTWQSGHVDRAPTSHVSVVRGPVADVLTVEGPAPGVRERRQTVVLYRDVRRIDCGLWLNKLPSGMKKEAVYVALPLNVPGFTIRHELPGAVSEPFKDQVEGSCTAHHAIRGFTDFSNGRYGVTVAPIESPLVCYGAPRPSPMFVGGREDLFDRSQAYPPTSRLYLYLMNNMFDVNISWDQQGPAAFHWSLRSHAGDWRTGEASRFGRQTLVPLVAWRADGKQAGRAPDAKGLLAVSAPNIACSTLKAAEANGQGYILRLNETEGEATTVTVSLPFLGGAITAVNETSLVEDDRPQSLKVRKGDSFTCDLPAWSVKTFRVLCAPTKPMPAVAGLQAVAAADMQVDLAWTGDTAGRVSHYAVYRDTAPACEPVLLNLVEHVAAARYADRPRLNQGGWIRNRLEPDTTYYYRVVPVDRHNNAGAPGDVVKVTTLKPEQKNLPPVPVEGLRAILVSPIARFNFVNLLFRTACESDIAGYEIHRSTAAGFQPGDATRIGRVDNNAIIPGSEAYGHTPLAYPVKEFDHAMFADHQVEPGIDYVYRVCAVDTAGQRGAYSAEVAIRTKGPLLPAGWRVQAQSVYAPEYGRELALDSDPDPFRAWIAAPYGGGTAAAPSDTWWSVEFPAGKPLTLKAVEIIGDHREVIPLQQAMQLQIPDGGGGWKTVAEAKDVRTKDFRIELPAARAVPALRLFVPTAAIPRVPGQHTDGIVRVCELQFLLPDGRCVTATELEQAKGVAP